MGEWNDHVLPHGELVQLAPNFWHVDGTLKRQPLPRTMALARLPSGGLWIHSPIALDNPHMAQIEALGAPEVVVVPSGLHRLDAAPFRRRYPDALLVCPEAARKAVETVVAVDDTAESALPPLGVRCIHPPGGKADELVYEVPLPDGVALVFCDGVFNLDHQPGFGGWTLRMLGSSGFFGTTRIGRFFLQDRRAWKAWLAAQANRDDIRLISMAHGRPIVDACAEHLERASERL